ncbi:hypothetical protein [Mumia zhuanghuii]|uniref:Uncharacterized protein n=1 Tax=Mumia zhuanghuii TaxID=2585211 RepID=A0A5C4LWF4_9ACTN|nr:hypothetical protein [Mumia zhuanghuii]TNC22172.1 hypothetical protein FHE65_35835 [Mumia zhuanghuii]
MLLRLLQQGEQVAHAWRCGLRLQEHQLLPRGLPWPFERLPERRLLRVQVHEVACRFLPEPRRMDRPKRTPDLAPMLQDQLYLRLPRVVGLVEGAEELLQLRPRLEHDPSATHGLPLQQLTGRAARHDSAPPLEMWADREPEGDALRWPPMARKARSRDAL